MNRAALTSLVSCFLLAGCVALGPVGTSAPSSVPTGATATASPDATTFPSAAQTVAPSTTGAATGAPTATSTVAATATPQSTQAPTLDATLPPPSEPPSLEPSAEPTAEPTQAVTPEPSESPTIASPDVLFLDEMDDNAGEWGIGQTGGGVLGFSDGALQFEVNPGGSWMWSRRDTGGDSAALKIVGTFLPETPGRFGLLCAEGADALLGATIDTDGGWSFVSIGAEGADVLLDDGEAGLTVPVGSSTVIGLDCSATATGSLRMQLNLTGTGPIAIYESQEGPQSFNRAAAYAEAFDDAATIRLETVYAFGTGDPAGGMDPDAEELLGHVPDDWQDTCYDTPLPPILGARAETMLTCFIGDVSVGAEMAEYIQFGSKEDMDAAYEIHVDRFPVGSAFDSCRDGSGEHSYSIGNLDTGDVLCADQVVGIRFVWTDDRLNILSTMVDHAGSYGDTFEDWLVGGPNV